MWYSKNEKLVCFQKQTTGAKKDIKAGGEERRSRAGRKRELAVPFPSPPLPLLPDADTDTDRQTEMAAADSPRPKRVQRPMRAPCPLPALPPRARLASALAQCRVSGGSGGSKEEVRAQRVVCVCARVCVCVCVLAEGIEKRETRGERKRRDVSTIISNRRSPTADRRSCLALSQPTDRPRPAQQAYVRAAQARAQARAQAPLPQPRASWQPTSATVRQHHRRRHHHARPFWRPSRPWAATWTCGACRPFPRGDAAWRLVNPQGGRGKGRRKERWMQRSGKVAAAAAALLSTTTFVVARLLRLRVTAAARCSVTCPLLLCLLAPVRTGIHAEARRSSSTQD